MGSTTVICCIYMYVVPIHTSKSESRTLARSRILCPVLSHLFKTRHLPPRQVVSSSMSADSELVAALRAQLARQTEQREAAEAVAARETALRKAAEKERDKATARAAAVTRQASLDASLALLATLALAVRSSQWQSQVLPKLTPLPFPETLLPELQPHVRDALVIAVRSIKPLPDDASETGEETAGTVHWLVDQLVDAAQSVLPPRWTVLHEPRCLGGDVAGGDKKRRPDVPDWVLLDPRDSPSWRTAAGFVEAKAFARADKSTDALFEEGYVSVTRYAAQALLEQTSADSAQPLAVVCLVTNGRTLQALYYKLDPRAVTSHISLFMSVPMPLFVEGQGLAPGVELLALVLHASPQHLSGCAMALPTHVTLPADSDGSQLPLELGRRLGVGGFCDVFEMAGSNPPAVVKLLRRHASPSNAARALAQLRQEAEALRATQSCNHLPQLLRCSFGDTPYLLLSPEGVPLMQLLCLIETAELKIAAVEMAARHVLQALHCAHERGFLHNDLRTCNVVGVTPPAGSAAAATRFLLVDWGLSQRIGASMNVGVVGYTPCACNAALTSAGRNTWVATRATDVECTAYLCATALEGSPSGRPPWVQATLLRAFGEEDELRPESRLLRARNDWLGQQTTQSLPKRVLQRAAELARASDMADVTRFYTLDD